MAIIDLRNPDLGRRLGSAISRIASGPHAKERRDFSSNLQRNPNLLRELRQIAADSPDPLKALKDIFPNIDDPRLQAIIDVRQTSGQVVEDLTRTKLTPIDEGGTATPGQLEDIGETGAARAVGATPEQVAAGPSRAEAVRELPQKVFERGAEIREGGQTPGQLAADTFNAEIFGAAMQAVGEMDLDEKAAAALRAKLPEAFNDPDRQLDFQRREDLLGQQLRAAAERDRLNRLSRESEGRLNREQRDRLAQLSGESATTAAQARISVFEETQAARWLDKTNVGTPDAWRRFLYDRDSQDRARGLVNGTIQPETQADIALKGVAEAFAGADDVDKVVERAAVQRQVSSLIEQIDSVDRGGSLSLDETTRGHLVLQLNSSLTELAALTGNPQGVASLGRGPFGGKGPVKIMSPEETEAEQTREAEIDRQVGLESGGGGVNTETQVFNFETVDVSQLSQESIQNLRLLQNGASFEALRNAAPKSADEILAALRR